MEVIRLKEPKTITEAAMESAELYSFSAGDVGLYSNVSPEKSTPNEDSAVLIPLSKTQAVLAVADGVGGHRGGGKASKIAVETLLTTIVQGFAKKQELRSLILDAFEMANSTICALGTGAATTLSVVEIHNNWVRPYHVGDSFVMIVGQKGKIKLCSVAHSPVGYAVAAGMMDNRQAMASEDSHYVSNIVGSEDMRIEVGSPTQLSPRDTVLISSDGLTDNVYLTDIIEEVRKGELIDSVNDLAKKCRHKMMNTQTEKQSHPDDLTVMLYRAPNVL